jgi:hypothetical protein
MDQEDELDECVIDQTLKVKEFSLLSCCSIPGTSMIACAGSCINEKKNGSAFLGTPVYIVDTNLEEPIVS